MIGQYISTSFPFFVGSYEILKQHCGRSKCIPSCMDATHRRTQNHVSIYLLYSWYYIGSWIWTIYVSVRKTIIKKSDTNHIKTARKNCDSQSVPNTRRAKWSPRTTSELWKTKKKQWNGKQKDPSFCHHPLRLSKKQRQAVTVTRPNLATPTQQSPSLKPTADREKTTVKSQSSSPTEEVSTLIFFLYKYQGKQPHVHDVFITKS